MPAFRAGFTAVTRDESRHVNYGIWALREAVRNGHAGDIQAVVDRSLAPCLRVYINPQRLIDIPAEIPIKDRVDSRDNWNYAIDSVSRRLRAAGVDPAYIEATQERGWEIVWKSVAEYEDIHQREHPVREHQRAEAS
jgi:ribonucleoside-diphosphate reductase beta chain